MAHLSIGSITRGGAIAPHSHEYTTTAALIGPSPPHRVGDAMLQAPSYQQPDLVKVWDKVSERYRSIDITAPDHRANMERFLECVGPPAGRSFCEVGSGSGTTSAALARMDARITLVDISTKSLAFARGHFEGLGLRAHYAIQDGLRLGFRDGSF